MIREKELKALLNEFGRLVKQIQVVRHELAALRKLNPEDADAFEVMNDQVAAVVESTEEASNSIMSAMDDLTASIAELRLRQSEIDVDAALERMAGLTARVYEACAFQDLTGQRLARVVKLLNFVESRIGTIISIWGASELQRIVDDFNDKVLSKGDLLSGPQRQGEGASQEDIDRMFSLSEVVAPCDPDENKRGKTTN